VRGLLIGCLLALAAFVPIGAALLSPLLAWRDPIYIAAGLAGVVALSLLLIQPLLAANALPMISVRTARRLHRWVGCVLLVCLTIHVVGLWITSPPDVIDALTFNSPTPFSVWGVIAMWALLAAALLAMLRAHFRTRQRVWKTLHKTLAAIVVLSTAMHAMKIDGTMEIVSKSVICGLVLIALLYSLRKLSERATT